MYHDPNRQRSIERRVSKRIVADILAADTQTKPWTVGRVSFATWRQALCEAQSMALYGNRAVEISHEDGRRYLVQPNGDLIGGAV
jgi:hypothetical protein